jgi:hypothetical protein
MRRKPVWIIVTVVAVATSALAAFAGAASAASPAAACNAWTGHHPPYAVEISGVVALSRCDIWATGIPGQNPTAAFRTDLLHWNGQQWSLITSPGVPASPNDLPGIAATSASDVWVAGSIEDNTAGQLSQQVTLIGHWDGTAFTRVPSPDPTPAPVPNELSGVFATSAHSAWAVGRYSYVDPVLATEWTDPLVAHWTGRAWTQVPAAIPAGGQSMFAEFRAVTARCACDTWAVGDYDAVTADSDQLTLIERWNGRAWTIVPSPNLRLSNQLNAVSADSPADAWAVGYHDTQHAGTATLIEHWTGHAWTIVPSPDPGPQGVLLGVAAVSPSNAWAAGFYVKKTGGTQQSLLLHWNGASWTQVTVPHFGPGNAPNLLDAASASSPRNVVVAGYYSGAAGVGQQALVLHYG